VNGFFRDLDEKVHRAAKVAACVREETLNAFIVRAIRTAVVDPVAAKILGFVRKRAVPKPARIIRSTRTRQSNR
jgi:hypothetical protein